MNDVGKHLINYLNADSTTPFEPCKATKKLFDEAAFYWDGKEGEMYFVESQEDWSDLGLTADDWEDFIEELGESWWDNAIEVGGEETGDPLVTCYMDFVPEYQQHDHERIEEAKMQVQRHTDLYEIAFDYSDNAGMDEAMAVLKGFMDEHPGYIYLSDKNVATLSAKYVNERPESQHSSLADEARDARAASANLSQNEPLKAVTSMEL